MGDLFLPLFAVLFVLMRQDPGATWGDVAVPYTLGGLALYLGFCWVTTALTVRRHRAQGDEAGSFALPGLHKLLHFSAFVLFLLETDWARLAGLLVFGLPFLDTILGMAPLFVMTAGRAFLTHGVAARRVPQPWSLPHYVLFQQRVMALPILPLVALDGLRKLLLDQGDFARYVQSYVPLSVLFSLVTVVFVFSLAPLLIRFVLGARPLDPGPLRDRLEEYGRRTGFTPNDILVWNTGGAVTNALYVGIMPRLRYVVITDALMTSLDAEAVEAVYAHEAGHGVKLHTQLYLVMITGFMLFTVGTTDYLEAVVTDLARIGAGLGPLGALLPELATLVFFVGTLVAFLFFVFGWLSRRFETEADLHAVQTLGEPGAIGRALESIGLHMGVLGRRGGMRHFGIGRRLGLINRFRHETEFREGFVRLLRRCRVGVVVFFFAGLGLVLLRLPSFIERGDVVYAQSLYFEAREARDLPVLREAADRARARLADPGVSELARQVLLAALSSLADERLKRGEVGHARALLREMEEQGGEPGPLGAFNRELLRVSLLLLDGKADHEGVKRLETSLDDLDRRMPLDPVSVRETRGELYLMERAVASRGARPGKVENWPPEARVLVWWDHGAPAGEVLEPGILEALAAPGARSQFRSTLFEQATGRSLDEVLRVATQR